MNFLKASYWTGISTGIQILSGFIINKLISLNLGASGLATIGQFRDFISIVQSFANGGVQTGIVKYSSEYKDNEIALSKFVSTAFWVCLFCSFITSIAIFVYRNEICLKIFSSVEYVEIISLMSYTLVLFVFNTFLISILNGLKEIKKFVFANIISSLLGLLLTLILLYEFGLSGALISLAVNQSIIFFATFLVFKSSAYYKISLFSKGLVRKDLLNLLKYSVMFLISALTIPFVLIIVRKHIGTTLSWEDAGYWDGMWRLSSMYILFLTTTFAVYLIPTFSELEDKYLKREIFKVWKIVVPVTLILFTIIYSFKDLIIFLLFSKEFVPMSELFLFQLIGDFFKINSWVLGNVIIAKAKVKPFIIVQIGWSILFYALSIFFIDLWGLIGVTIAYFVSYLINFILLNSYFIRLLWL